MEREQRSLEELEARAAAQGRSIEDLEALVAGLRLAHSQLSASWGELAASVYDRLRDIEAGRAGEPEKAAGELASRINRRPFAGPRAYMVLGFSGSEESRMPMPGSPVPGVLLGVVHSDGAAMGRDLQVLAERQFDFAQAVDRTALFRIPAGAILFQRRARVHLEVPTP